jgi:alkylhydroperoxidase family enzyme
VALIRLADKSELSGDALAMAESGESQYGQLLNTWRAIMNKPDLFAAYLPFLRQVAGPGVLEPAIKDVCALYVGYLNHCRYTASHRATSAQKNGVDALMLESAVTGDWAELDPRLAVALEFTRQLTVNPAEITYDELPQAVTREVLDALTVHFTDVEILELAMSTSVWNALSRFHRVMGFDLDMPPAPSGANPA